ncbi:DEKNAAC101743 [Brettanomyces naardenensis]|uniref:DEKNAAC101743 n=1 Tax=Brettanomyces naardenensis TaxID=13370 RepID=A0A448YIW2_BRENA|nr:DEKNAAC101743 [Brettanomyces naardenensis]
MSSDIDTANDGHRDGVLSDHPREQQEIPTDDQISGFELFPRIVLPEGGKRRDNSHESSANPFSYKNTGTNGSEACIDDEESEILDDKLSNENTFNEREILEGSSRDSKKDDESSDLRSSILNRILDEDIPGHSAEVDNHRARFYYKNLYDKFKISDLSGVSDTGAKNMTDFDRYNWSLMREEKIRDKLQQMRGDRNRRRGYVSYLPTLDIGELDNGYIKPLDTQVMRPHHMRRRQENHRWYQRFFGGTKGSYKSGEDESNGPEGPFADPASISNQNLVDKLSMTTTPIDDYSGVDDTPVELQTYYNTGGSDRKQFMSIRPHVRAESESVDMIVSNQDDVDYNFQPIYANSDLEKDRAGRIPNERIPRENANGKGFSAFLRSINPARIVRDHMNKRYQIQRRLKLRHLHQIALGGTLGVGLLLSSGKAFSIAGPLGCLIGFAIAGLIVLSTMLSFCEMVTLIPLCGGVSGVSSRFVDDAFGFALGVGYWFSYMIGMPTEITAASIMLSFYPSLKIPGSNTCGWIAFFLIFATTMNLCDIRVYGEFEYYSTIIKLLVIIALMIYMIVLNCGGSAPLHQPIGFRYWDSSKSDLAHFITFGPFRPTFDVNDTGLGALGGIGGAGGRLCQVLIATVVAAYAYVGTEIVIIAGSEARNPRRAIPSATRNIYWRIFIFYILSIFVVGLNIYSGDPRLLRYFSVGKDSSGYLTSGSQEQEVIKRVGGNLCKTHMLTWAGFSNGNQSPFVIAIQSAGLCSFAGVANAFLLYFAVTAATSQLYASSRTLYFLAIQGKAPKVFSVCSKNGVPYASVLFTAAFGCLAFLSVNNNTAMVFERLLSVCASSGLIVWCGMCLSFIRFYYGLKLRPDIINRDDENYPYKSPFQPYLAYFGMISSFVTVIISGFLVFLRGEWSPAHFVSCYGSLFLFIFCYFTYKVFRRTKIHRLDQLDLDSGRREIDRIIWEDEQNYASNFKEILHRGINLLL